MASVSSHVRAGTLVLSHLQDLCSLVACDSILFGTQRPAAREMFVYLSCCWVTCGPYFKSLVEGRTFSSPLLLDTWDDFGGR
jgi:hypothetical protein